MQEGPNRIRGTAGTRVKYAAAIHGGARAHVIRPRRYRGMLRFYWDVTGQVEFFRSVNHPGVGATPFLTTAMRQACTPLGFRIVLTETRVDEAQL